MNFWKKVYNKIYLNSDTYAPNAAKSFSTLNIDGAYEKTDDPVQIGANITLALNDKIPFHSYWYGEIGRKQALSIKSILVTQDMTKVEVILWLDKENGYVGHENNKYIQELLPYITIKEYNPIKAISGTIFEKCKWLFTEKDYLPYRADAFRMWALNQFGGVYFDLDILFLKDFSRLLSGPEFCYPWEYQNYANNALLYFRKGSFLNDYISRKVCRLQCTRPWILFNFKDKKLKNFMVYPCAMFDPIWNQDHESFKIHTFEEFFDKKIFEAPMTFEEVRDAFFPNAYAYHWHNMWSRNIAKGSFYESFENAINSKLRYLYE